MDSEKKIVDKEVSTDLVEKLKLQEERQTTLNLIKSATDEKAEIQYERRLAREKEKFQLLGGGETSFYEKRIEREKILSELPQEYEPKFVEFFASLGKLLGWTEDVLREYHKPAIAAKTINETIYDRFPENVRIHIQSKNPYVKWCVRKHKNYVFLGDDGILLLEEYIYKAITVMSESTSYYDFRERLFRKHQVPYQTDIFEGM